MLVSATEMINKAHEGHYAIPAFNTNNLEWTQCILKAVQETQTPVMIQTSESAAKYMGGYKMVVDMVNDLIDSMGITVPVALHLDHGTYDGAKACIEAGYSSVMFDGSHYSIEENIEKSKEIIALAHSKGVSVECEVGGIGGTEDGVTSLVLTLSVLVKSRQLSMVSQWFFMVVVVFLSSRHQRLFHLVYQRSTSIQSFS